LKLRQIAGGTGHSFSQNCYFRKNGDLRTLRGRDISKAASPAHTKTPKRTNQPGLCSGRTSEILPKSTANTVSI
jgi:hypothetical protein